MSVPEDRNVRLRMEMAKDGELVLQYSGWKFDGATLRLTPKVVNRELLWKCGVSKIPLDWVESFCFQIEQQRLAVGFDPSAVPARRPAASGPPEPSEAADPGPATWAVPFRSRAALDGEAAIAAEGLSRLEPFQRFAEQYYLMHDHSLPSSAAELEDRFSEEERRFRIGGAGGPDDPSHFGVVSFGPTATLYLKVAGVTLVVSPMLRNR